MLRSSLRTLQAATMAQSWRLNELTASCGPDDIVFSRRVPNRGSSFFAWPGLSATEVAQGMLQMPDNLRTAHVVFGRPNTPLDLALDIDEKLPIGREFRDTVKVRAYQRKCLEESLLAVHGALKERGEKIESQVVLISPNLEKLSFHVHIKLANKAFKDFSHLSAFVKAVISPKVPKADTQIYRQNGSLRLYQSKKEDNTCAMALYDDVFQIGIPHEGAASAAGKKKKGAATSAAPKKKKQMVYRSAAAAAAAAEAEKKKEQAEIAKQVAADYTCPISQEAIMLHSFIVRPRDTFSDFVNITAEELEIARRSSYQAFAPDSENAIRAADIGPYKKPLMPLTTAEAILNAKMWILSLPEELAMHYQDWIRVGLYAFRIAIEFEEKFYELYGNGKKPLPTGIDSVSPCQELLRAWVEFSKRCPHKYRIGDCETRWSQMRKSATVPFYSAYCNLAALTRHGQPEV